MRIGLLSDGKTWVNDSDWHSGVVGFIESADEGQTWSAALAFDSRAECEDWARGRDEVLLCWAYWPPTVWLASGVTEEEARRVVMDAIGGAA